MRRDLISFFEGIERPRIAVVGDAIVDEYVWGDVARVSPEAPVMVLQVARREYRAGGAGSVVTNLAALKADVRFFSVRGEDGAGERLRSLLEKDGADTTGLVVEPNRPTTQKTRHMGYVQHANRAVQQLLRVDDEVRESIRDTTQSAILERFRARAADLDAVLVSDYHKGLVSGGLLRSLQAAAPGVPFLVDPALVDDYSLYEGCHLICPNRYEAGKASRIDCNDFAGCAAAAEKLARDLRIDAVALTMDRDGIWLHERASEGRHFPTRARTVADVTGAGDMVLSILGLATAAGGTLAQAVELANVAAGIEIRKVGVTPLSRSEILQEMRYEGRPGAGKIKTLEELVPIAQQAREAGRTVVFTNGCFDLLHAGHRHLLQGAAREGEVLIVAANSDASVRRIKGPGRPRTKEEQRLLDIADLSSVDYVICFDDDKPLALLEALRPHVLVKGEEYREGVVVGRELVEGWGGRVAFVSQIPGISTSSLLGDR